jgi:hypothetical protein
MRNKMRKELSKLAFIEGLTRLALIVAVVVLAIAALAGCSSEHDRKVSCRIGKEMQKNVQDCSAIKGCIVELSDVRRMNAYLAYCE